MSKTKIILAPRGKMEEKKIIPHCYNLDLECLPNTTALKPWKMIEILRGVSLEVCT